MHISQNIKHLRLLHNLSQKELADKIGKVPSAISGYESGKKEAPISVLQEIADFFGVSITDLVGEDLTQQAGESLPTYHTTREKRLLHENIDRLEEELATLRRLEESIAGNPEALAKLRELDPNLAALIQQMFENKRENPG